jgi:hypothetical protein
VSGTTQVGYAYIGGVYHAGRWSGTAASWVELNQAGAAYGIFGTQEVGYASVNGSNHASFWNGTAASWVDLYSTYTGTSASSYAYAATATQQVGVKMVPTEYGVDTTHAVLWSGTAESMIDLNPWDLQNENSPARCSAAYGIFGPYQVGHVNFDSINAIGHACVWTGSPESWEDLSLALTGSWNSSVAQCIWSDGTRLNISGYGSNASTGRYEAILWSRPLAASCYANCDGSTATPLLNANDFQCFINKFAAGDSYANCDGSTVPPILNVNDFQCFLNAFATGCN